MGTEKNQHKAPSGGHSLENHDWYDLDPIVALAGGVRVFVPRKMIQDDKEGTMSASRQARRIADQIPPLVVRTSCPESNDRGRG